MDGRSIPPWQIVMESNQMSRTLMAEEAAAAHIAMSVAYLRADRVRGCVGGRTPGPPFYRIGRTIRYDLADLDEWLSEQRIDRKRAPPASSEAA